MLTSEGLRRKVVRDLPEVPRRQVIAEPVQRNTGPAIGLAARLLAEQDPEAVMGVFPSDHFIARQAVFRKVVRRAVRAASDKHLIVLGGDFVRRLIESGRVSACHDVSDGGLFVAVAEMALAGGVGAALAPPAGGPPPHAWLFGEDQARYVIAAAPMDAATIVVEAVAVGVPAAEIGRTGGDSLTVSGDHPISLSELRGAYEGWLPGYMAGG